MSHRPAEADSGDPKPPSQEALRDWLALAAAPRVGPRTFARLLEQIGSPDAVRRASRDRLERVGLRRDAIDAIQQPDEQQLDLALSWAEQPDAHILTLHDSRYPPALREIPDPPPLLYAKGDLAVLDEPQIAVVGSRNPTPGGRDITQELAGRLARCGLVITSGMAVGVDGVAHAAALDAGHQTIAVLGTGPDLVYPAVHRDLARRIVASGVMVTELPPGRGPVAQSFPRRNRIISGLSLGVLVTEAALKSGSLITARAAIEQGREVFAVPGSIRNPLARGCHALIREGAKLVEGVDEILAELAPQLSVLLAQTGPEEAGDDPGPAGRPVDPDQDRLLEAMGFDPVAPDDLIERTGLPAERITSMLLLMELDGHVSSAPGGRYCRCRETR